MMYTGYIKYKSMNISYNFIDYISYMDIISIINIIKINITKYDYIEIRIKPLK